MPTDIRRLIEEWDGLAVIVRHDAPTGCTMFIAIHDDTLGRPAGGTRMRVYDDPADGLRDAMRLAEGMTHKWAVIGIDSGGAKAVLALSRPLAAGERDGLIVRYARLVNALRGGFATGEDLGTTPRDMQRLAEHTRYVHIGEAELRDPGPFTAVGVLAGIESAVRRAWGGALAGRTVLIQGVGDVGEPLARECARAGARLLVADVDPERARRVAVAVKGDVVPPADVDSTPCDVLAPCAVGATLHGTSIPKLRCRIVAGSANNQLAEPEDAERLHERGILYAPDYVINAGGAMAFGLHARGERDVDVLRERVRSLGATLDRIFAEAAERSESPLHSARRLVEEALRRARGQARG